MPLQAALTDECNSLLQKLKLEEEKTGSSEVSNGKTPAGPKANEDSLDAFMSDVKVELQHGKVIALANCLSCIRQKSSLVPTDCKSTIASQDYLFTL